MGRVGVALLHRGGAWVSIKRSVGHPLNGFEGRRAFCKEENVWLIT